MENKKNIFMFSLFIIIILLLTVSYAFITRNIKAENIFTFGSLKLKLIETTMENGKELPVENSQNINVNKNSKISRIIKVKNIGKHPMFVRISLNAIAKNKDKKEVNITNCIFFDINDESWIYKDGWYYYKEPLLPDKTTSNLIEYITFNVNMISNYHKINSFNLEINAHALQSENNSKDVLDAKGWPSN